jgi:3-hydroxypropanoate dehydrogenase
MSVLVENNQILDGATVDRIFRDSRTAYAFTDEQVTDADLVRIAELVENPPTAMNTQPLRVVFIRSDDAKARLLPLLAEGNRPKSQSAPVVAILAADIDFHDELPRVLPHVPDAKARFADDVARERTAMFNATLQAGYFLLAVRAAGLDAGPMGGFDRDGVDREFFADGRHRSLLVVNIGHGFDDGGFPRSPRLSFDEVFTQV